MLGMARPVGRVPVKALSDTSRDTRFGNSDAPYSTSPMLPARKHSNQIMAGTDTNSIGMPRGS